MKRTTSSIIVLSALMAMGALDVAAQQAGDRERRRPARGGGVEAIMQMRDRLELTEGQIAELEEIRRETVARRSAEMADMAEMRSRLRAGEIRRSELMAFMEDRRDANAGVADEHRARVDAVLSEEQLAAVQEMRTRARDGVRGRQGVRRGPRGGFRPGAGPGARVPRDGVGQGGLGFEPGG
jgi:hypothetical protein